MLITLRDQCKTRMIGISNTYDVSVLEALVKKGKVDVVQNRWYEGNGWDKDVYQYCMINDIQYQFCPSFTPFNYAQSNHFSFFEKSVLSKK